MPKHYEDGRIFRLRSNPAPNCNGPELTFRISHEELEMLRKIDQSKISAKQRATISDLVGLLINSDDEVVNERLNRRFAKITQDGSRTHDVETSVKAAPKRRKWSENLALTYRVIRESGETGVTDEQGGIRFARLRNRPTAIGAGDTWRPSRGALVKAGLVRHNNEKRELVSGHMGKVWVVTNPNWEPPEKNQYLDMTHAQEN